MKLSHSKECPIAGRHSERGFATVFAVAIIGILCIVLLANSTSVQRAFKEVRRVEQRQTKQSPWLVPQAAPSNTESK